MTPRSTFSKTRLNVIFSFSAKLILFIVCYAFPRFKGTQSYLCLNTESNISLFLPGLEAKQSSGDKISDWWKGNNSDVDPENI